MLDQPRTQPTRVIALLSAIVLAACGAHAAPDEHDSGDQELSPRQLNARVNNTFGLHRSEIVRSIVDGTPTDSVFAFIPSEAGPFVLSLSTSSVRSATYQVLVQNADGALQSVQPTPVRTVRGEVLNMPEASVAGSMFDDGLHARIMMPGGREYWIEPIAGRIAGAEHDQYVVYSADDVDGANATCAAGEHMRIEQAFNGGRSNGGARGAPGARGIGLSVAELACDADVEYYQDYGSVANVENQINSVINTVNLQYESEVDITHQITTIIVRTSEPDPYSSSDAVTLLNQFRNHWNSQHSNVQRDMAQLFTGKELNSSTIGIAWLGAVCTNYGYSVVQSDFNNNFSCATDLSAHELGHNWNADHCNCTSYTMNAYITCANTFHPNLTVPEIVNFRDSIGCLDSGGGDPTGACCINDSCATRTEADCTSAGGIYLGDFTDCNDNPCSTPTGACCIDGSCSVLTQTECSDAGGTYQGDGTDCTNDPCFTPTGACCVDGACTVLTEAECTGTYLGDGTDCSNNPCDTGGDVINLATSDFATSAGSVQSGSYLDTHTQNDVYEQLREEHTGGPPQNRVSLLSHTWTFNVAPGASYSFNIDAYHDSNDEPDDFVFSYSTDNVSYTPMLIVDVTADDDTLQTFQFSEDIAGTVYVRVEDTDQTPGNGRTHSVFVDEMFIVSFESDGGDPTGACCIAGDCQILTQTDCVNLGGTYQGDGTSCSPSPCGGATTMFVNSVSASVFNAGGGNKHGVAQVTVLDDFGNPVDGATVTGTFTGEFSETQSATTNADGVAELMTDAAVKGNPSFQFCVDDVTHASLTYDEGSNNATCASN